VPKRVSTFNSENILLVSQRQICLIVLHIIVTKSVIYPVVQQGL